MTDEAEEAARQRAGEDLFAEHTLSPPQKRELQAMI